MRLRPARPSTVTRERRDGDIRRLVEVPADNEPTELSAEAKKFMAELHNRRGREKPLAKIGVNSASINQ
jgi:hypothetical protein